MNVGKIEQVGSPREVYDKPATDFVMGFLGPVSRIDGKLVRPHDVAVSLVPAEDAIEAMVSRVVHLGFEVRVELELPDGERARAQLTRGQTEELELARGDIVYVRPRWSGRSPAPAAGVDGMASARGVGGSAVLSRPTRHATTSAATKPRSARDPGLRVLGQLVDRLRQPSGGDIGDGDVLDDAAEVGAHGDPDAQQRLGGTAVLGFLGRPAADAGERPLDRPDHVGDRDLGRRLGEPKAALGAAVAAHDSGVAELAEDVLQEVERDRPGRSRSARP